MPPNNQLLATIIARFREDLLTRDLNEAAGVDALCHQLELPQAPSRAQIINAVTIALTGNATQTPDN